MAATVSAWGNKPGAWALDSEENEAELYQLQKETPIAGKSNGASDFPSLSAAATTKTKKKKAQPLSLSEFSTYTAPKAAAPELLVLPTGPRERSAEELDRTKLGGGFRSYGGGSARDERPRRGDSDREFMPSRADEVDNWGAGKKSAVGGGGGGFERRERGERGERGSFFGDSQSRADDVDNWGAGKKSFVPAETRRVERRGSFGFDSGNSGAESGNWSKKSGGGAFDSLANRRGGSDMDSESWGRKREEMSVGSGVGGGRPKLNLQPRTLPPIVVEEQKTGAEDVVKPEAEEEKISIDIVVKPRTSNPFGAARPREEVLKEKGQDWKEIEEKLESTKLKEVVPADGPAVAKKGFWSGNGLDKLQREEKAERAWRKPDLVEPRPQSAGESENGGPENTENGHIENTENGHAKEDGETESQI